MKEGYSIPTLITLIFFRSDSSIPRDIFDDADDDEGANIADRALEKHFILTGKNYVKS